MDIWRHMDFEDVIIALSAIQTFFDILFDKFKQAELLKQQALGAAPK